MLSVLTQVVRCYERLHSVGSFKILGPNAAGFWMCLMESETVQTIEKHGSILVEMGWWCLSDLLWLAGKIASPNSVGV